MVLDFAFQLVSIAVRLPFAVSDSNQIFAVLPRFHRDADGIPKLLASDVNDLVEHWLELMEVRYDAVRVTIEDAPLLVQRVLQQVVRGLALLFPLS